MSPTDERINFDFFFNTASVGGVFGLCLGASTISLIEVIYFIVIRVFGRIFFNALSNHSSNKPIAAAKQMDNKIFKKACNLRNRRIYHSEYPFATQYVD